MIANADSSNYTDEQGLIDVVLMERFRGSQILSSKDGITNPDQRVFSVLFNVP
jgi:hypothetical protein